MQKKVYMGGAVITASVLLIGSVFASQGKPMLIQGIETSIVPSPTLIPTDTPIPTAILYPTRAIQPTAYIQPTQVPQPTNTPSPVEKKEEPKITVCDKAKGECPNQPNVTVCTENCDKKSNVKINVNTQ